MIHVSRVDPSRAKVRLTIAHAVNRTSLMRDDLTLSQHEFVEMWGVVLGRVSAAALVQSNSSSCALDLTPYVVTQPTTQ